MYSMLLSVIVYNFLCAWGKADLLNDFGELLLDQDRRLQSNVLLSERGLKYRNEKCDTSPTNIPFSSLYTIEKDGNISGMYFPPSSKCQCRQVWLLKGTHIDYVDSPLPHHTYQCEVSLTEFLSEINSVEVGWVSLLQEPAEVFYVNKQEGLVKVIVDMFESSIIA